MLMHSERGRKVYCTEILLIFTVIVFLWKTFCALRDIAHQTLTLWALASLEPFFSELEDLRIQEI